MLNEIQSTVKNEFAAMANDILDASKSKNEIVSSTVHLYYRDHYVNLENNDNGAKDLLRAIMAETKMPEGSENGSFRNIAIGNALFFSEIENEVRAAFGFHRYPSMSIRSFLTLAKHLGKQVKIIQLTNHEDKGRPKNSKRPRVKYYLAE